MKRTYKIALSLVMTLGIVAPAFGQDSYPDVQDTHWAADAIKRLKLEKFIQGMPNGKFEGQNTMTRYEMASIAYAVYAKLVCFRDETANKIKDLEAKINKKSAEMNEVPSAPDTSDIKAALASLKSEVGTMKAWGADINMLKKMAGTYQKELSSLGVDVADMKKQLNSLSDRVTALEKKTANVIIGGDANFWAFAGIKDSGFPTGINQDGRWSVGNVNGAGYDTLGVSHELGLSIKSGAQADRAWGAELVYGNMLNTIGDMASWAPQLGTTYANSAVGNGPAGNVYINTAWISAPEILGSTIGRQGLNLGSYILARPDITSFYSNQRWDNGHYLIDGIKTGSYSFGPVKANAYLGQINGQPNVGAPVQPITLNGLAINRVSGATLEFALGSVANLVGNYALFDGAAGGTNRVNVWGLDGDFKVANVAFKGGYGKSVGQFNQTTTTDTENARWNVSADLFKGLSAGYMRVERNYFAPGDWGRFGIVRNLNDVKGWNVGATHQFGDKFTVSGGYMDLDQITTGGDAISWNANVATKITGAWDLNVGYEKTEYKTAFLGVAAGSFANFSTVGLNYNAPNGALLRLFYQYGDTNGVATVAGTTVQKGGFVGLQYGIKF